MKRYATTGGETLLQRRGHVIERRSRDGDLYLYRLVPTDRPWLPGLREGPNDKVDVTRFTRSKETWVQHGLKFGRWWIPLTKWRTVA